ncbi:MAG: transaldolase family protein, partial [Methylococcales bacterium]
MIELYLDSVDITQIRRLNACLPVKGVTTNPSILAHADMGVTQALSEIATIIDDARFHVQVVSQTVDEIV